MAAIRKTEIRSRESILKRLINRALKSGVKKIFIADPGRSPFEELTDYYQNQGLGKAQNWRIRYPRPIKGRILRIESSR